MPSYISTVIAAQTGAVSAKQPFSAEGAESVTVSANLLAGAEEVDLFMDSNGTWLVLADSEGTAIKLTATITMLVLEGGNRYAATKDATVGACGVYVTRNKKHR